MSSPKCLEPDCGKICHCGQHSAYDNHPIVEMLCPACQQAEDEKQAEFEARREKESFSLWKHLKDEPYTEYDESESFFL